MKIDPAEWQLLAAIADAFEAPMILHQYGPETDDLMAILDGEPHDARVNDALPIGVYRLAPDGLVEIPPEQMFVALIVNGSITPNDRH